MRSGRVDFTEYLGVHYVPETGELLVFVAALIGGGLGFLWYNAPPAAVFMGDTGSLALGGALGAIAVATKHEIVLAIIGGLFVVEALCVIIQVLYYKRTQEAGIPDGADPPPLREARLGGAADRHPLLDRIADPGDGRARHAEAALSLHFSCTSHAQSMHASNAFPFTGPLPMSEDDYVGGNPRWCALPGSEA